MPSEPPPPEPDKSGSVIYVGQDLAGHWLVQDAGKQLEGCFISFAAAIAYAQGERHLYHATVEISTSPLFPLISYPPVSAQERALPRAA